MPTKEWSFFQEGWFALAAAVALGAVFFTVDSCHKEKQDRRAEASTPQAVVLADGSHLRETDVAKRLAGKYKAVAEFRLPDACRIDLLSDRYAIEVDWAHGEKWAEAVGQAIYYAAEINRLEPNTPPQTPGRHSPDRWRSGRGPLHRTLSPRVRRMRRAALRRGRGWLIPRGFADFLA